MYSHLENSICDSYMRVMSFYEIYRMKLSRYKTISINLNRINGHMNHLNDDCNR